MKPTEPSHIETLPPTPETSSCFGPLLRLFWVAFGGVGLFICAIKLMLEYLPNLVLLPGCAFLLASLMIGTRYADISYFNPTDLRRPSDDGGLILHK
jgi:hypothetical protein